MLPVHILLLLLLVCVRQDLLPIQAVHAACSHTQTRTHVLLLSCDPICPPALPTRSLPCDRERSRLSSSKSNQLPCVCVCIRLCSLTDPDTVSQSEERGNPNDCRNERSACAANSRFNPFCPTLLCFVSSVCLCVTRSEGKERNHRKDRRPGRGTGRKHIFPSNYSVCFGASRRRRTMMTAGIGQAERLEW